MARFKANRPLAGFERPQVVLERFQGLRAHRVKRAMIGPAAQGDERAPIQFERGESIADAFFGLWGDAADGLPEGFQGGLVLRAHSGEVLVDGLGFSWHNPSLEKRADQT